MGRVYRARDLRLHRIVALKMLAPALMGEREALIRLRSEAQTASRLNHPALVTIHDVGETPDGQIFVAMELIDGVSLREWFREAHSFAEAAELLAQAADGLAAAHAAGVVHRDVKPDNIMVARQGFAKVVDFGLAKTRLESGIDDGDTPTAFLTQDGRITGTVVYMAPEQLRGETVDGSCDVFALGSVLHEALNDAAPFSAKTAMETIGRILHEPPPPPPSGTDPRIVALLSRMLRKKPAQRPSMQEVASALRTIGRGTDPRETFPTANDGGPTRLDSPSPKKISRLTIGTVGLVAVATIATIGWLNSKRIATAPPVVNAKRDEPARPLEPAVAEIYAKAQFFASDAKWPAQDQSIPLLEEVVRRDPKFLAAREALAQQYARRAFARDPDRMWEQKAFLEVDRILRFDPDSAVAHRTLGNLKWTIARGFPHEEAMIEYSKAIERDPGYVGAIASRAGLLMHVGMLDEALSEYERASRLLERMDRDNLLRVARIHLWQGNYSMALRELREYNPDNWQIAVALNGLGRQEEALAFARRGIDSDEGDSLSVYAMVLARRGRRAEAENAIAKVFAAGGTSSHFHHALYNVASAWAQLGEVSKAVEALERVSREGMPCYPLFASDPMLDPIRNDPRFLRFLDDSRDAHAARRHTFSKYIRH